MIRARGLSHLRLAVRDLERSARFYAEVFGFEVLRAGGDVAVLEAPGARGALVLVRCRAPRTARFGLALPSDDVEVLDAVLGAAAQRGGRVLERTTHPVGGASAAVADPDGHVVDL